MNVVEESLAATHPPIPASTVTHPTELMPTMPVRVAIPLAVVGVVMLAGMFAAVVIAVIS